MYGLSKWEKVQEVKSALIFGVIFFGMIAAFVSFHYRWENTPERVAETQARHQVWIDFIEAKEHYRPYNDIREFLSAFEEVKNYVHLVRMYKSGMRDDLGICYLAGSNIIGSSVLVPYQYNKLEKVSLNQLFDGFQWMDDQGKLHVFGVRK